MRFYAIDINEKAAAIAKRTFCEGNGLPSWKLEVVTSDFTRNLEKIEGKIDILIFNPPYVPCTDEEMEHALKFKDSTAAWAGGLHGREIIDRVIPKVRTYLSPTGCFYLLLIEDNVIPQVVSQILEWANQPEAANESELAFEVIMKREWLGERQVIIKFYFKTV